MNPNQNESCGKLKIIADILMQEMKFDKHII